MAPSALLRRSALVLSRHVAARPIVPLSSRALTTSIARRADKSGDHKPAELQPKLVAFEATTTRSPSPPILTTPALQAPPISTMTHLADKTTNADVKTEADLLPPGAEPGEVPTDVEQATGLERLELLGKMQGVDVFDMRPLDASRKGTLDNPIVVNSAGKEQFAGCTGYPADSHVVHWLGMSRERPINRCIECGGVYRMEYIGPPDDPHAHGHGHGDGHHEYEEAKTFADFVKPEYRGTPQPHYGHGY